jgi:hypothetical protein
MLPQQPLTGLQDTYGIIQISSSRRTFCTMQTSCSLTLRVIVTLLAGHLWRLFRPAALGGLCVLCRHSVSAAGALREALAHLQRPDGHLPAGLRGGHLCTGRSKGSTGALQVRTFGMRNRLCTYYASCAHRWTNSRCCVCLSMLLLDLASRLCAGVVTLYCWPMPRQYSCIV